MHGVTHGLRGNSCPHAVGTKGVGIVSSRRGRPGVSSLGGGGAPVVLNVGQRLGQNFMASTTGQKFDGGHSHGAVAFTWLSDEADRGHHIHLWGCSFGKGHQIQLWGSSRAWWWSLEPLAMYPVAFTMGQCQQQHPVSPPRTPAVGQRLWLWEWHPDPCSLCSHRQDVGCRGASPIPVATARWDPRRTVPGCRQ